jgi:hypothetical protein
VTGIHLCNVRLRLLRLNTMPALDAKLLEDISVLRSKSSRDLRALGRLPYPCCADGASRASGGLPGRRR